MGSAIVQPIFFQETIAELHKGTVNTDGRVWLQSAVTSAQRVPLHLTHFVLNNCSPSVDWSPYTQMLKIEPFVYSMNCNKVFFLRGFCARQRQQKSMLEFVVTPPSISCSGWVIELCTPQGQHPAAGFIHLFLTPGEGGSCPWSLLLQIRNQEEKPSGKFCLTSLFCVSKQFTQLLPNLYFTLLWDRKQVWVSWLVFQLEGRKIKKSCSLEKYFFHAACFSVKTK